VVASFGEPGTSYRTELQRRKEAKEETAAQEARRQREATVQRENRADELHGHIEANSTGVGVVLTQEGTRLILQHNNSKDTVYIDADVSRYNLMKVKASTAKFLNVKPS
jgi:hypothetical protein